MEKVILVALKLPGRKLEDVQDSLSELESLSETAGARASEIIIQRKERIDPAYFIGKGKAEEIKTIAGKHGIGTLIIDEDLKPVQQKNLKELTGLKIIDRTRLILDIFAQRARSKEGMLQVELAQLNYMLPRITERFGRFEQQTGGIGTRRGPGERKLEIDQRRIRDRIASLNREIDDLGFQRQTLRKQRSESGGPGVIAITGYTNAGKSTLLNAVSGAKKVYADDKLFATLDPATRRVKLPNGRIVLFTDTVGFINKLPHALIAAFRATLEEIAFSNCIIHLTDISHPDWRAQEDVVNSVLKELGADKVPFINVYNKADLIEERARIKALKEGRILISAKTGYGIPEMLKTLGTMLSPKLASHTFTLPYVSSNLIGEIYSLAVVKKQTYTEKGIGLLIGCTRENWDKIKLLIRKQ